MCFTVCHSEQLPVERRVNPDRWDCWNAFSEDPRHQHRAPSEVHITRLGNWIGIPWSQHHQSRMEAGGLPLDVGRYIKGRILNTFQAQCAERRLTKLCNVLLDSNSGCDRRRRHRSQLDSTFFGQGPQSDCNRPSARSRGKAARLLAGVLLRGTECHGCSCRLSEELHIRRGHWALPRRPRLDSRSKRLFHRPHLAPHQPY